MEAGWKKIRLEEKKGSIHSRRSSGVPVIQKEKENEKEKHDSVNFFIYFHS